jgi:nucleoid-associated protein YgaU
MGLFSFVKSAGRKIGLFGGAAAAEAEVKADASKSKNDEKAENDACAAQLKSVVTELGLAVTNLGVSFAPDTATITGTAKTQADREKIILAIGNNAGVGQVDDQMGVEVQAPAAVFHTVESGDTLSKISLSQYGVIHKYDDIFEANKPMLKHPDEIFPGQVLRIPQISTVLHTVAAGETLGSIAKHWYGKAGRYNEIFEANKDILKDANSVAVGQVLSIPSTSPA